MSNVVRDPEGMLQFAQALSGYCYELARISDNLENAVAIAENGMKEDAACREAAKKIKDLIEIINSLSDLDEIAGIYERSAKSIKGYSM